MDFAEKRMLQHLHAEIALLQQQLILHHHHTVDDQQRLVAQHCWENSETIRNLARDCAFPERRAARNDAERDVIVWAFGDDGDSSSSGSGSTEVLNLLDDENEDEQNEDQQEEQKQRNYAHHEGERAQEALMAQLGFLNRRHAMFAAAGVIPDEREVEMWGQQQSGVDVPGNRHNGRSVTPGAAFLINASQQQQMNNLNSSVISTKSSSQVAAASSSSSSPPRLRTRKPTLTVRTLLTLASPQEITEFEHCPQIVAQIAPSVMARQLAAIDAVHLIWLFFSEAETNGRVSAACISALDRVFVAIMTHDKLAREFGTPCARVFLRCMCDVLNRWQYLASGDEQIVVKVLLSTLLGGDDARAAALDAVDSTAFLIRGRWARMPSAMLQLRHSFSASFAGQGAQQFAVAAKSAAHHHQHVAALREVLLLSKC